MKIQKNKTKTGSYHFRIKMLMMSIYKIIAKAKKVVPEKAIGFKSTGPVF